jgi:hypothetical protein
MSANVMKEEIYQYLKDADVRFLNLVYSMVKVDKEEKISKNLFSKYDVNDLMDRTLASEEDIKYGRTTKIEVFKEEIDNWKSKRRIK